MQKMCFFLYKLRMLICGIPHQVMVYFVTSALQEVP